VLNKTAVSICYKCGLFLPLLLMVIIISNITSHQET